MSVKKWVMDITESEFINPNYIITFKVYIKSNGFGEANEYYVQAIIHEHDRPIVLSVHATEDLARRAIKKTLLFCEMDYKGVT